MIGLVDVLALAFLWYEPLEGSEAVGRGVNRTDVVECDAVAVGCGPALARVRVAVIHSPSLE